MRIYARAVRSRGRRPDWNMIVKDVARAIDAEIKPLLISRFNEIVENWRHRPEFRARKIITTNNITLYVYPAGDEKWLWVLISRTGSRPHLIVPRTKAALAFIWGGPGSYEPKTTPRPTWGGPGVVKGDTKLYIRKSVQHPGFAPRRFEEYITEDKELRKHVSRIIENALRRAIRRSQSSK